MGWKYDSLNKIPQRHGWPNKFCFGSTKILSIPVKQIFCNLHEFQVMMLITLGPTRGLVLRHFAAVTVFQKLKYGVNKCCCQATSEWGHFWCLAHFWWQPTARQFFRFWLNIDIKVNNMSVLIIGCSSNWGGIWLLWWDICVVYNMKLIQQIAWPDGSPEPATLDKISIEPFPVIIQTGATITLDSQVLPQQYHRRPQLDCD